MSFRNVLTADHTEQPTVYNLYFGKKYYTWKGKNLEHSVETICRDIDRLIVKGVPPDHNLKKVIDHIIRTRVLFCRVEILLQTDNVAELIEFENLTLEKGKVDPDCLNVKFEAHIPKWISEAGDVPPKSATENKPRRDTLALPGVQTHQSVTKTSPAIKKQSATGKVSLMDALAKLNK